MKTNKKELITNLSERLGRTRKETQFDVNELIDCIKDELHAGNTVSIQGFGKFYLKETQYKTVTVKFAPSSSFKGEFNE